MNTNNQVFVQKKSKLSSNNQKPKDDKPSGLAELDQPEIEDYWEILYNETN